MGRSLGRPVECLAVPRLPAHPGRYGTRRPRSIRAVRHVTGCLYGSEVREWEKVSGRARTCRWLDVSRFGFGLPIHWLRSRVTRRRPLSPHRQVLRSDLRYAGCRRVSLPAISALLSVIPSVGSGHCYSDLAVRMSGYLTHFRVSALPPSAFRLLTSDIIHPRNLPSLDLVRGYRHSLVP